MQHAKTAADIDVVGTRYHDFFKSSKFYEVKTGVANFRSIARQLAYDIEAATLDERNITYVFVASQRTGIGPDATALNFLEDAGVPIQIYWP